MCNHQGWGGFHVAECDKQITSEKPKARTLIQLTPFVDDLYWCTRRTQHGWTTKIKLENNKKMKIKTKRLSDGDRRFISMTETERSNKLDQQILVSINYFSPSPCMSGRGSDVSQVWRIFIFVVADEMCCFTAWPFDLAKYRATVSPSWTFAECEFVVLQKLTKNQAFTTKKTSFPSNLHAFCIFLH